MSKKTVKSKKPSFWHIAGTWFGTILSVGLCVTLAKIVTSDFESFRSCSADVGLVATDCGKQSVNSGDVLLCLLFILSAVLVVCCATVAWRVSKARNA
jgi:hypothetical protein